MFCVCLFIPLIIFRFLQPIFMKLGTYIMASALISTAYFINPSHQYMCVCVTPLSLLGNCSVSMLPRQRIHETIGELSDVSFYMRFVSYQRRICGSVYPLIVARQQLGKHVPAEKNIVGGFAFYAIHVISR
jgi:hypothetical protein